MGHVFVTHGDLTRLACDALAIPCDSEGNVNGVWSRILPDNLPPSGHDPRWLSLADGPGEARAIRLPAADGREGWAFATVDMSGLATPKQVVEKTWTALTYIVERTGKPANRRRLLIGIPLPGTGHGGLEVHRSKVIEKLLKRFRTMPIDADVALVLRDRRDFAAVQVCRKNRDWTLLPKEFRDHADRLGVLAARGELSLFVGAGVSVPVGMPSWWALLDALADEAKAPRPPHEGNQFKAAAPLVELLSAKRYHKVMRRQLKKRQYGIGHALLASLGAQRMVTTNFDRCMETALTADSSDTFRVLTRQLANGDSPWLLKINGDVEQPDSIVLTDADLERHPKERRALEGVVQSLLLTSHLFFVGFSLTDDNFLKLATAVSKVRARAQDKIPLKPGTAVALTDQDCNQAKYRDVHMLTMAPGSAAKGAHMLEMFLDRLLWTAATQGNLSSEYLLDDRYASGLTKRDSELRNLLLSIPEAADTEARLSSGWRRVEKCLRELGMDEERLR